MYLWQNNLKQNECGNRLPIIYQTFYELFGIINSYYWKKMYLKFLSINLFYKCAVEHLLFSKKCSWN